MARHGIGRMRDHFSLVTNYVYHAGGPRSMRWITEFYGLQRLTNRPFFNQVQRVRRFNDRTRIYARQPVPAKYRAVVTRYHYMGIVDYAVHMLNNQCLFKSPHEAGYTRDMTCLLTKGFASRLARPKDRLKMAKVLKKHGKTVPVLF